MGTGGQMRELVHALEAVRRQALARAGRAAAILALVALAAAVYLRAGSGSWVGGYFIALGSLLVWAFYLSRQTRRFVAAFKVQLMPELVRALGPELGYEPFSGLEAWEFEECGLFASPDHYYGRDLVTGYVGETHVRFSLVHAEEEYEVTDTDDDGYTTSRTEYRDIFRGLLFSADCNKHFAGRTYVVAGSSGFFARMRRSYVQLEDPRFNAIFTVYASDQVEARYLLTPNLMERIVALRQRAKKVQLSFVEGRVYIALPMKLDTFAPSLWRRIDDLEAVVVYHRTLRAMVGMVDDLNLNTRIWSKQPPRRASRGRRR